MLTFLSCLKRTVLVIGPANWPDFREIQQNHRVSSLYLLPPYSHYSLLYSSLCSFAPHSHFLWISLATKTYFPVGHRETWGQCRKPRKKINRKLLGWLIVAISAIAVQWSQFVLFPKAQRSCMSLLFSHMILFSAAESTNSQYPSTQV